MAHRRAPVETVSVVWPQILDAMNQDSGIPLTQLQVDGGMTSNRLLMQLQADILCIPVGEIYSFVCFRTSGKVVLT